MSSCSCWVGYWASQETTRNTAPFISMSTQQNSNTNGNDTLIGVPSENNSNEGKVEDVQQEREREANGADRAGPMTMSDDSMYLMKVIAN